MEIHITKKDNTDIIELSGKLDGVTSEDAEKEIIPIIKSDCLLIFNMKNCTYISSAGLRLLLMIAKKLESVNGKGCIANLNDEIEDVMKMTGFGNIFKSFDSVETAINSF